MTQDETGEVTLTTEQVAHIIGRAPSTTRNMLAENEIISTLVMGRGHGKRQVALQDVLDYCRKAGITPDLSGLSLTALPQTVQESGTVTSSPPLTEQHADADPFLGDKKYENLEYYDVEEEQGDGYRDEEGYTYEDEFGNQIGNEHHEFVFIDRLNMLHCRFCPLAYHFERDANKHPATWVMVQVPVREHADV